MLTASDVVSLHVPLTPETKHLINAERLEMMKPTAYLVNTSRGPVVDEQALVAALDGVDIEKAIETAAMPVVAAAAPVAAAGEKKEEKKKDAAEEKKTEEAAAAGLGALFG